MVSPENRWSDRLTTRIRNNKYRYQKPSLSLQNGYNIPFILQVMEKKTIREHLDQRTTWKCKQLSPLSRNSFHDDWPLISSRNITDWKDFSLDTFEYHYPRLLDYEVDCPSLTKPPGKATYITGEDTVQGLINGTVGFVLGHIFESVSSKLGRDIWFGVGSLCNLGNQVPKQITTKKFS